MVASETVLLRAHGIVARALRSFPFAIRAALPVDPDDPPDVRLWIARTLDAAKPGRFGGPPGAVVRRLRWTALDAARRARRRLPRGRDHRILLLPDAAMLDGVADRPVWKVEWAQALDNLAEDAATAAASLVSAARVGVRPRKAAALLACLGRTVAAVQADVGTQVSAAYARHLMADPAFVRLPLRPAQLRQFRTAMAALNADPGVVPPAARTNLRRTLHAIGQPWAEARQWREFAQAFDRQRRLRLEARQPPP